MREPMIAEFPLEEYRQRLNKLINGMHQQGMDAVILSSKENVRYFVGLRSIVWDSKIAVPGVLIINANGDMTIVSSASNQPTVIATTVLSPETLISYSASAKDGPHTFSEGMAYAIEKLGLKSARVGMELGTGFRLQFPYPNQQAVFSLLSQAEVLDAGPLLWKIRRIKSTAEIAILRRACEINSLAYEKGFSSIVCGKTTESELNQIIVMESFRLGAEGMCPLGIRCGLERYPQGNCPPSDRIIGLQEGEMMLVDGGPCYKGYYSDIIRQAVSGKPTDRQRTLFHIAAEGNILGLSMICPGLPIREVTNAIDKFYADKGFDNLNRSRGWTGHGIGLDVHELPTIDQGCEEVFEPGMVMSLEPELFDPTCGVFGVEQNFLVTETGCEVLTLVPTDLIELPM